MVCLICSILGGRPKKELPELEYSGSLTYADLFHILSEKFPDVPLYLPDLVYATCKKEDIERFLAWDSTNDQKYIAEKFDCDDYSYRFKGNITVPPWAWLPVGIVWTDKHALNCFVDSDNNFWFIEPQSDRIQEKLEPWQGDKLRFIAL